jgi:hypothetical protein
VDGIQLETSVDYIRPENVQTYAEVLGEAILSFMEMHYGFTLNQADARLCPAFADVRPGQPFYSAIESLYKEDLLPACSSDPRLFCPGAPLTRADAARMIGEVIRRRSATPAMAEAIYRDIPAGDPLVPWTSLMWQAGIGFSCRVDRLAFCPDRAFSRAEAARAFLYLLKGQEYVPPSPAGLFADLPRDDWTTWWAEAAYSEGIIQPCAGGPSLQFCPDAPLSRGEAAGLLAIVADARPARVGLADAGKPRGVGEISNASTTMR